MKGHKHHEHHAHGGKAHHYGHVVHHEHPRAEHKKGGKVKKAEHPMEGDWAHDEAPKDVYEGANSNVVKEAEEKKHGGKVHKARAKRKHGGHVHHMGHVHGEHAKHRADRPKRKSGGKVGSNMHPLSSAAHGQEPSGHKSYEPDRD